MSMSGHCFLKIMLTMLQYNKQGAFREGHFVAKADMEHIYRKQKDTNQPDDLALQCFSNPAA